MPDRIVRTGILSSEAVNSLASSGNWGAEVFYRRLMQVADDFGRYDGRPSVLRAMLYPLLLERVRETDIVTWIKCACEAGLIRLYHCPEGKPHVEILKFGQRQQSKSKWPVPVTNGDIPQFTVKHGDSPPIRESESKTDSETAPPKPPRAAVRLPQTVEEAVAGGTGGGVPPMFCKEIFLEHQGTAWTYAGKEITNWSSYLGSRWLKVKDIQAQREKYMSAPKKAYCKPESAVTKHADLPDWMPLADESRRLLADPGANATRLRELADLLPNAGWQFLEMNDRNALLKIKKEAA